MKFTSYAIPCERHSCAGSGPRRASARPARAASLLTGFIILLALNSFSQTLTGTVTNGTTQKPAAGDDVVLIKLGQGMEEAARTKTDGKGSFSFKLPDTGPHLIRAIHQDVTYHRMAPPGTTSVQVEVYDAARKVGEVSAVADLMSVQAAQGQMGINRVFAVNNASKPPRTQVNDQNFEFYLPDGAEIDSAQAQTAGGQWVNASLVPQAEKGRYAFNFPLRPGETEFQVTCHLSYNGSIKIDPRPLYPLQHLVLILPQSIQFSPAKNGVYQSKQPPDQPGAIAEIAVNVGPGQPLAFELSGTGRLLDENSASEANAPADGSRDSRPGGGLGPPIDAPDPLEKYRWYILGGFALVLAGGAVYVARSRTSQVPDFAAADFEAPSQSSASKPSARGRSALLLEALKEELFQLEVEHKQGSISQQEYDKAKAALDQTLKRALKRTSTT